MERIVEVKGSSQIELHFPSVDRAEATLQVEADERHRELLEFLSFSALSYRQAVNLGPQRAWAIADLLMAADDADEVAEFFSTHTMTIPLASRSKRRFVGHLSLSRGAASYRFTARGFGFFARGIVPYAVASVAATATMILSGHLEDEPYASRFVDLVQAVGKTIADRTRGSSRLSVINQHQYALNDAARCSQWK